jgi:hypothetical protein
MVRRDVRLSSADTDFINRNFIDRLQDSKERHANGEDTDEATREGGSGRLHLRGTTIAGRAADLEAAALKLAGYNFGDSRQSSG